MNLNNCTKNGIFNYYDGVVKSSTYFNTPTDTSNCILGEITNTPNGYIVKRKFSDRITEAYLDME